MKKNFLIYSRNFRFITIFNVLYMIRILSQTKNLFVPLRKPNLVFFAWRLSCAALPTNWNSQNVCLCQKAFSSLYTYQEFLLSLKSKTAFMWNLNKSFTLALKQINLSIFHQLSLFIRKKRSILSFNNGSLFLLRVWEFSS